jgi:tRNA pseudouridine55 synthase
MAKAKRGATTLNGVIAIDKPQGITSHDVVDRLRRITGEGRIGHAGTLDPLATGLLLVCIGQATKLSERLMVGDKRYQARVVFGTATDSDDADGQVIATAALPAELSEPEFAATVLSGFIGEQQQLPPRFSAVKKQGRKAYELARAGQEVLLEPKTITIHQLRALAVAADYWDIEALVSKGSYIRSLARDIGEAVGSKAHVGALRRTASGLVTVDKAHHLEELAAMERLQPGSIRSLFLRPVEDLGLDLDDVRFAATPKPPGPPGRRPAGQRPAGQRGGGKHRDSGSGQQVSGSGQALGV